MARLISKAEAYLLDAIEAHKKASEAVRRAKDLAFDCGLYLISAHQHYEAEYPGEWTLFLETHGSDLKRATAYRYMRFAQDCMQWAVENNPRLKDPLAIQKAARDMVMQSGLSFIDLLRELGIIKSKEPGGRANPKHRERQMEFGFEWGTFSDSVWSLAQSGAVALKEVPTENLQETCSHLETSLQIARDELQSRTAGAEAQKILPAPEANAPVDNAASPAVPVRQSAISNPKSAIV